MQFVPLLQKFVWALDNLKLKDLHFRNTSIQQPYLGSTALIGMDLEDKNTLSVWILEEDCKFCWGGETGKLRGLNETLKVQQ